VLTLVLVAQFAVHALPLPAASAILVGLAPDDVMPVIGTVVQMPASPRGARAQRSTAKTGARRGAAATKPARPSAAPSARIVRPDPVEDETALDDVADEVRSADNVVRITIIGPDGQARTKLVRLASSRDGMAAPARRPHD
jgi:hypothetical protein